jgi:hypothetical protein
MKVSFSVPTKLDSFCSCSHRIQLILFSPADAMFRTYNKAQKFEEQYEILLNNDNHEMRPCMRFFITATPVPVLLALGQEEDVDDIKFERITPCDDYLGVKEMVSFLLSGLKRNICWVTANL